ncbi:hypothetical protein ACR6C2_40070 [Streptomyces sp. INA 01156]
MPRTAQLRTYSVREGLLDEWVERWRSRAAEYERVGKAADVRLAAMGNQLFAVRSRDPGFP